MLHLQVPDTRMVLMLDPAVENARSELYKDLLTLFGFCAMQREYQYQCHPKISESPYSRCYDSAMECASVHDLMYVEGLLLINMVDYVQVMGHGWCVSPDGYVVDPVLHRNQHSGSLRYYGVPIKREYSMKWMNTVGYFGCLDGDMSGRPIGIHYDSPSMWLASQEDK